MYALLFVVAHMMHGMFTPFDMNLHQFWVVMNTSRTALHSAAAQASPVLNACVLCKHNRRGLVDARLLSITILASQT